MLTLAGNRNSNDVLKLNVFCYVSAELIEILTFYVKVFKS